MAQPVNTARRIHWELTFDDDGFKTYMARYLVRITLPSPLSGNTVPGPQIAANQTGAITGLPTPGLSFWTEGADSDLTCVCLRMGDCKPAQVEGGDPHEYFTIERQFSNKPQTLDPSQDPSDPTSFGPTFSGSFVSDSKEVRQDKDGNQIVSSSWEQVKGPTVQFEDDRDTVVIEQNSRLLQLNEITALKNKVNASAIWGITGTRTVKAKPVTWQRRWSSQVAGGYYFVRRFEFEIDRDTFDPDDILDEGTKMVRGKWNEAGNTYTADGDVPATDPAQNFMARATDPAGNLMHVLLDGNGRPMEDDADPTVIPLITDQGSVKVYKEFTNAELQALGINTDDFLLSTNLF